MSNKDVYKAIEELNKEKQDVFNSPYYVLGWGIKRYLNLLGHFKFKEIYDGLKILHINNKVDKELSDDTKDDKEVINFDKTCEDKKIAVYTCVTGGYDDIHAPLVFFDNADYYLVTDDVEKYKKYSNIYKIIKLDDEIIKLGNTYANRYAKFHPFNFFKGYDYSIYIDGSVRVLSDIRPFVYKSDIKSGVAMHKHSGRKCAYKEAKACIMKGKGNGELIAAQMERYKKEGFPSMFGLNECGVIAVDLKNDNAKVLLEAWWDEFLNSKSLRDQLSWPYVVWKNGFTMADVGSLGSNINENYKFELITHK